jgi:serine/threonine-protein kinase
MHDAIVRYFVFTVEPVLQRPYLAMEYVDGRSLADMLEEGPLTLEALLRLTKRVASGLKAAHERGIIHRDVSPDNIIITQNDVARAKIIDFGIARSTQLAEATIIGSGFAGKHNHVSPEQIGLYGGEVNAPSDVYSLGLVMFYALTGQKLDMGGTQFQLVEKRRRVPDLGAIDARIRPLFEQMLQPDPKDRPTMAQIENWNIGAPTRAPPPRAERTEIIPAKATPAPGPMRRRLRRAAIAAAVLLLIGLSGAAYYYLVWAVPAAINPSSTPPSQSDQATLRPSDSTSPKDSAKDPPSKPPLQGPDRSDVARRFLQQFDGGDCFFILPVAIGTSAAVVEGFGSSTTAFDALDKSFKRSLGFEASIGIRLVTPPQCPAISFLNKVRGDPSRAPRISLGSVKIRPNETITGNIENFANRVVELLLVSEDGQVQNLSYALGPGTDALSFSVEMKRSEGGLGSSVPQLIMAVSTPRVLDSLRQPRPTPADQFFLQVLSEAQRSNMTISAFARYVVIQK